MLKIVSFIRSSACASVVGLLAIAAGSAIAAPTITGTDGRAFIHKASVMINGTGFGTKSTAAPVVWDDASGSSISAKWDLTWPNANSAYNLDYRTPQRGISLPHNNITRYIAGAQYGSGANSGAAVMAWKNRTISSYPAYTYASWYQRADDAWSFEPSGQGLNNFKVFDFTRGTGGYDLPYNWYIEYNARPESRTNTPAWHILDDAYNLPQFGLDGPTSRWWFNSAVNPMAGQWSKIELQIKYSRNTDGYIKLWENGVSRINYTGRTDMYDGSSRSEGIGGYGSARSSNNWRYFADIYLDYTTARVVLANNSVLSNATVIEPQIPTSWTDSSIEFKVNIGKLSSSQPAYIFVIDASGNVNTTGVQVTLGGAAIAPPSAPGSLQVL